MKPALLVWLLLFALTAAASAQTPAIELRATGTHTAAAGDSNEIAQQLALADAEHKLLLAIVARLQEVAELKALKLSPDAIAAYVTAIFEFPPPSNGTRVTLQPPVTEAVLVYQLDPAELTRRLLKIRRDQDATFALAELWAGTKALYEQLGDETQRLAALKAIRVTRLVAQLTAEIAKTEERPVGGRASQADAGRRAKRLADAALQLSSDAADAHYGMGLVLMNANEPAAAVEEYRKALAADPNRSSGHTRLANALLADQKVPEATAELREALRLDPKSVQAHTDMGWILRAQKNIPEAIAEYQEALGVDPDFIDAHNGLAITLASQGRLEEAVEQFRAIVRIDPDSAVGFYNLAYALADMDKDDESAAALREVVRINPSHYNARYNLGELLRLEGKFDESARQFREYLRLAPDEPQNRRNIERAKDFVAKFENQ